MTIKLKSLFQRIVSSPESELQVHFHQGPQGQPAACHNPRCASPHLTV